MPTPAETLQADLKASLIAGERERTATLRLLLSAVNNERIRRGEPVDEAGFLALVRRAIKQRYESAEQYRKGGREELAAKEAREAAILEEYLPPQADEDQIRAAVREYVAAEGLSGPGAIGPVMKAMLARFAGQADGGTINRIARDVLTG
ncbi:MAG: GatB/YqeY domain-containing protein [Thermoanaerobaculia bacterium]|nr:GatB/YqeY domain-containing protein [Thermoanaerobaculia bacterium]